MKGKANLDYCTAKQQHAVSSEVEVLSECQRTLIEPWEVEAAACLPDLRIWTPSLILSMLVLLMECDKV